MNKQSLDIYNSKPREIKCIRNDNFGFGSLSKANELKVGKIYHLEDVQIFNWYTDVYIEEFPNIPFNSVLFNEVEQ